MLVKECKEYPKLYKIVISYRSIHEISAYENLPLNSAFSWSSTPEGAHFWGNLSTYNIEEAKKIYPDLFEEQGFVDGVKKRRNGLWR